MAKKILVVVDAQNDFITGALGNKECDVATNVIADEIRSGKYDDVIFTRDTHDENYLNTQEGKKLPVAHCIKGTNGWEVDARLKDAMKERGVFVTILLILTRHRCAANSLVDFLLNMKTAIHIFISADSAQEYA